MPVPNTNNYRGRADGVTEIVTRKGDVFLIDTADEPMTRRHCWSRQTNGYARAVTRVDGKLATVYLHRLLCPTSLERPHVDHANGNIVDCRRSNLRARTRSQNQQNQKRRNDNSTGHKGVGVHAQTGKFRARIRKAGREAHLGLFDTAEEAAAAAIRARASAHGEFARHA